MLPQDYFGGGIPELPGGTALPGDGPAAPDPMEAAMATALFEAVGESLDEERGPATAKEKLPKKLRKAEARVELAKRISAAIKEGIRAKGDLPERIALNERLVQNRNVIPDKLPWPGAQHYHIPLAGPRLQQRKANLVSMITGQDPIFRLTHLGSRERVEPAEQTVQFFFDIVGWKENFDIAAQMAMETNCAIWRVTYQEYDNGYHGASHTGKFAGVVFDVIHPDLFVVYPANSGGIANSRFCGHRFDVRRAVVTQMQKTGEYLDDVEVKGSDEPYYMDRDPDALTEVDRHVTEDSDENIALYDGIWRDDLDGDGIEELYRVIIRESHDDLLLLEPYPLKYHHYVAMQIKREWGRFWAEGSPAQDAQGLQLLLNALVNEFVWGVQMASRPPVLTENWDLNQESIVGYEPGEYRNVRNIGKVSPVPVQFNPNGFDFIVSLVKSFADSVTKTSETLTGAPSSSREATATEQNIKYQAFQLGSSDDVVAITQSLRQLVMLTLNILSANFSSWYPVYGESVLVQDVSELTRPYTIELAGKSPADSPQLQSQQAQMLLQLAAMFPQGGLPLGALLKSIVTATSLPNKEDIIRYIEQTEQQAGQMPNVGLEDLMGMISGQGGQSGQQQPPGDADMAALLELLQHGQGDGGAGQNGTPGAGSLAHLMSNLGRGPNA
jgi:hypothetical protein